MIYAKITELKDRYMIYNAVKNERKWRNKKLDLDDDELIATRDGGKCEFCKEMFFIQQKPEKNYVWIRNTYCPMCGKKLK